MIYIVSFLFEDASIGKTWRLGRAVNVQGNDITIDYVNITSKSNPTSKTCIRSPQDCKIVLAESECAVFSNEYFSKLIENSFFQDAYQGPGREEGGGGPQGCEASPAT